MIPILAAVLPAFALAVWLVVQGASEQREQLFQRSELVANTIAFTLDQVMATHVGEVELLAASPLVTQPSSSEAIRSYLAEFLAVNSRWRTLSVADTDGWVIAGTSADAYEVYIGDRDYFREVLATGEPTVSDPVIGRKDGEPSIIVAAPVEFDGGSRGALFASLPLDWLHSVVAKHVPARSRVELVDRDGRLFVDPRWRDEMARPASGRAEEAELALGGRSGAIVTTSSAGDMMTAFAPIPGRQWAVLLSTPADEVFRYADSRLRTGLGLIALALGAILALSWSFGGRLAAAMQRVDEARGRAEEARRRASLAAEASKRLSAHDSYEETIPAVAQLACHELGAWCAVELVGEDGRARRLPIESDGERPLPAAVASSIKRKRASLQRGRAHVVSLDDGEHTSALVAPLASHERLLGWLVVVDADGREYGADELALAEDLGGRAAMAIVNAELYRKARESTLAREQVLNVVAHDLKSPLATIDLSVAALGRGEASSERGQRQLERVDRASKQMQRLIGDLLDAAKGQRAALCANATTHHAADLIRDVVEAYRPLAGEKNVRIAAESIPDAVNVFCDRDRVEQVLGNIVTNALKFTPPGGKVTLAASSQGREVSVEVRDSGPGIPPADLPRIFERFWHGAAHGGTGLGLAIAKAIVEAHGGRIWAENLPGGGAKFVFTLPAEAPHASTASAATA